MWANSSLCSDKKQTSFLNISYAMIHLELTFLFMYKGQLSLFLRPGANFIFFSLYFVKKNLETLEKNIFENEIIVFFN